MSNIDEFIAGASQFASVSMVPQLVGYLEGGISRFPREPKLFANLAQAYMHGGHWENAIEHSRKAIEVDPKYVDAYYNIGRCYLYSRDLENAKKSFEQGLEFAPQDAGILNNLGTIEAEIAIEARGRPNLEPALQYQRQWGNLYPDYTFDDNDLLFKIGLELKRENKFKSAKLCFERIGDRGYPDLAKNIAMLGHLDEIREEIDRLTTVRGATMNLYGFLGDDQAIPGFLSCIRDSDEAWVRLGYYVFEFAVERFALFEEMSAILERGDLPEKLPEQDGYLMFQVIEVSTGILHDLLTHFRSPNNLMGQFAGLPVWGNVQNVRIFDVLRVLIAVAKAPLTAGIIHGSLGMRSKVEAGENILAQYMDHLYKRLELGWAQWGAHPFSEGRT